MERLAPDIESTVYRLVQEALTNVSKHARASHVDVSVHDADGADRGRHPRRRERLRPAPALDGFGLVGMRERLALVHGTLDIDTSPGGGTALCASIPIRGRVTG